MRDSIGERRPLDEFEDQRGNPSGIFESVNRSNSGMVQGSEKPCLTVEPGEAIGIVDKRGWQYLDGDVSTELVVTSAIDLTHAATAEAIENLIGPELRSSSKANSSRDCTGQQSKSQIPCSDRLPEPERHPSSCGHQDSRDNEHD